MLVGRVARARRPRADRRRRPRDPGVGRRDAPRRCGGSPNAPAARVAAARAPTPRSSAAASGSTPPPGCSTTSSRSMIWIGARDRRVPPLRHRRRALPVERRVHRRRAGDRRAAQGERLPHRAVGALRGPLRRRRRAARRGRRAATGRRVVVDHIGLVTTRLAGHHEHAAHPERQAGAGAQPEPGSLVGDGAAAGARPTTPTPRGRRPRCAAWPGPSSSPTSCSSATSPPSRRSTGRWTSRCGRSSRSTTGHGRCSSSAPSTRWACPGGPKADTDVRRRRGCAPGRRAGDGWPAAPPRTARPRRQSPGSW